MRLAPILTIIVLAAGAAGGYAYWRQEQALRVPPGLARANGRIEVERVDVATKYAGRIAELRVDEGAFVQKDDVLVRIDTTEILAQLAAARAAVHRAHQSVARAQANVALREAELKLAEAELRRTAELARSDTATQAELDRRTAQREVSKSALAGAKVAIEDAKAATDAAEAQVAQIEATIADMTLKRRDVAEYSAGHHREFDAAVRAAVNSRLCHHVLLSGSFTPFESMPVFLQDIMYILPSTHFVRFAQSVLYRGAAIDVVWSDLAIMGVDGAFLAAALFRFRAMLARQT